MKEGELTSFDRMSLRLRHSSRSLQHVFAGDSRPIIFIHVPKTAGNSTTKYIQACIGAKHSGRQYMIHDNETKFGRDEDIKRARKATFVFGHMSWQAFDEIRNGRKVFAFTFLRDPLDRLLSNYTFLKRIKKPAHAEKHFPGIAGMSLDEYAACTHPRFQYGMDNFTVRQFAGSLDDYPDVTQPASAMLERAKAHLGSLDFVGFTDRYDNDFVRLIALAGLPQLSMTPRYNVTGQANVTRDSPDVSESTRKLLLDRVRVDMELWEFAKKTFAPNSVEEGALQSAKPVASLP